MSNSYKYILPNDLYDRTPLDADNAYRNKSYKIKQKIQQQNKDVVSDEVEINTEDLNESLQGYIKKLDSLILSNKSFVQTINSYYSFPINNIKITLVKDLGKILYQQEKINTNIKSLYLLLSQYQNFSFDFNIKGMKKLFEKADEYVKSVNKLIIKIRAANMGAYTGQIDVDEMIVRFYNYITTEFMPAFDPNSRNSILNLLPAGLAGGSNSKNYYAIPNGSYGGLNTSGLDPGQRRYL